MAVTVNPGGVMRTAPKPKVVSPSLKNLPTTFMGQTLNMAGRYGPTTPSKTGPTYLPQTSGTSGTTTTPPAPTAPAFNPNTYDPNTDPIYAGNIAAEHRTTQDSIAGLVRKITDSQNALPTFDYTQGIEDPTTGAWSGPGAALGRQYGLAVLAQQIANARTGGGGASSSLAQRIGNIGQTYGQKYTDAQTAAQNLAQSIGTPDASGNYAPGTQIAGLRSAESAYDTGQRGDAVARAAAAWQADPTVGGVAPPVTQPAAQPAPGAAPSGAPAVGSSAGAHGAIVAPYGANKPPDRAGYRTVGTGNGKWIYVKR